MRGLRLDPFQKSLVVSLSLHMALWQLFFWRDKIGFFKAPASIEIDLTRPFRLVDRPELARRSLNPGTGAPLVQNPAPAPAANVPVPPNPAAGPAVPGAQEPAKDWVLPGPNTKTLEEPRPEGGAGYTGPGGLGDGTGGGEVDLVYLTELPKILNGDEIRRFMDRFYPPLERQAGREGDVVLEIHIDSSGRVQAAEVASSAGDRFDQAAKKVIMEARFSPAKVREKAVPVKMKQPIAFRLLN